MQSPFRFFKNKPDHPKNRSTSRSSSRLTPTPRHKPRNTPRPTKAEQQLRNAIEGRYQKSRMRNYNFTRVTPASSLLSQNSRSSHSSQMKEFSELKRLRRVDLKEFHLGEQKARSTSRDRQPLKLRIKLKQYSPSSQGGQNSPHHSNPYLMKLPKSMTPTKIASNQEGFNFLSIQLKNKHRPFTNRPQTKQEHHHSHQRGVCQRNGDPKMRTGGENRHTKSNVVGHKSREESSRSNGAMKRAGVPRLDTNRLQKYKF